MTTPESLLAFLVAATILTVTPGTDTALMLRTAAVSGQRAAVFAGLGILLGCLVWGAMVSVGLGALLAASPLAFTALKWAGAIYLVWIGLQMLVRPRERLEAGDVAAARAEALAAFRRGLVTNALNPKVGVFYITFLPQLVPVGVNVAAYSFLLAVIHVVLTVFWFAAIVAATVPIGTLLRRPRVVRRLDRVTGSVFILFGVKLALTRQP